MAWSAAKKCYPQMNVCAARFCKLHADGTTVIGSSSLYVTAATVSLGITPVYDAGAEIKEKDGCGSTFVDVIADPALIRYDIDIDLWSTDPNILSIVLPDGDVLTGQSSNQGFGFPAPGTITGQFSFEFWQKIINANKLDPDFPYAHWAIPFCKNVQMQKRDVNGTAVSHTVIKAEAYQNTNWFDGPNNDFQTSTSYPVLYLPQATIPTANCAFDTVAS